MAFIREVHEGMETHGLTVGPHDFTPHATLAKTSVINGMKRAKKAGSRVIGEG